MDSANLNTEKSALYEMLLTKLCQCGLANACGWQRPVADPARALVDVITNSMMFGQRPIVPFMRELHQYADINQLINPLYPLICSKNQLSRILQIKRSCLNILSGVTDKDIFVLDAGPGSRMGNLLRRSESKGDINVCGCHKLYHYAAATAIWLVDSVKRMDKEYFAFVASDQIVCLSHKEKTQLKTILEVACLHDSDMIFFDGPPELSVIRLYSFFSQAVRPQRNSPLSLARDREMLRQFGGAHTFQCVLVKRSLMKELGRALEAIIKADKRGFNLDFGVYDVAIMPQLVRPNWLKKQNHSNALNIYEALCDLANKAQCIFPISIPIKVFNVNTPYILNQLKKRITNAKNVKGL